MMKGYIMKFPLHTIDSAPEESKALLQKSKKAYGWVPNLHAVMASNAQFLKGYQDLHELFQKSGFNNEELTVVWQTINVENQCHYCIPAHTGLAKAMKVRPAIIEALRSQAELPDSKLQVLHKTTLSLLRNRGRLTQEEIQEFESVGYTQQHILGIVLGIAQKVMSNYTNHLADTPLDEQFQAHV